MSIRKFYKKDAESACLALHGDYCEIDVKRKYSWHGPGNLKPAQRDQKRIWHKVRWRTEFKSTLQQRKPPAKMT